MNGMSNNPKMKLKNTTKERETMTKAEYIKQHPQTILASRLASNMWPDETSIKIIGGLDGRYCNRGNLNAALSDGQEAVRGGHRWRGTEGWWWAVSVSL